MWSPYTQLAADHQRKRQAAASDYRLARQARLASDAGRAGQRPRRRIRRRASMWFAGMGWLAVRGS